MDAAKTTVTVPEAARMLGISRNLAYQLARTARWPVSQSFAWVAEW